MVFFMLLFIWLVAYVVLLIWSLGKRSRLLGGGIAMAALSFVPTIYGRWTTPSDWHDSPTMALYYLPTLLAILVSLIVAVIGLAQLVRQALPTRGGA